MAAASMSSGRTLADEGPAAEIEAALRQFLAGVGRVDRDEGLGRQGTDVLDGVEAAHAGHDEVGDDQRVVPGVEHGVGEFVIAGCQDRLPEAEAFLQDAHHSRLDDRMVLGNDRRPILADVGRLCVFYPLVHQSTLPAGTK